MNRARIQWDANVIGTGRVEYGINSPDELSVGDQENVTAHSIELAGLTPGTTYQFRVSTVTRSRATASPQRPARSRRWRCHVTWSRQFDELRERVASYGLPRWASEEPGCQAGSGAQCLAGRRHRWSPQLAFGFPERGAGAVEQTY